MASEEISVADSRCWQSNTLLLLWLAKWPEVSKGNLYGLSVLVIFSSTLPWVEIVCKNIYHLGSNSSQLFRYFVHLWFTNNFFLLFFFCFSTAHIGMSFIQITIRVIVPVCGLTGHIAGREYMVSPAIDCIVTPPDWSLAYEQGCVDLTSHRLIALDFLGKIILCPAHASVAKKVT